MNKKSWLDYRSPPDKEFKEPEPDPVRHISKEQLDKLYNRKKKGVA